MSKSQQVTEAVLELPFRLDSIAQVGPPEGSDGTWFRYVISQGTNTITGMRAGSRAEVGVLLDEMIERLNERRRGKPRSK